MTAAHYNHKLPAPLKTENVEGATLYANRLDALAAWPKQGRIAELGVAYGNFSDQIISTLNPTKFDAYDTFILHTVDSLWGEPTEKTFRGKTHRQFYEDRFREGIDAGTVSLFEGDSSTSLLTSPPANYDLIYIDGNHSEQGVKRDTDAALRAIKPGGLLVFNDYVFFNRTSRPFGVMHVANDLCVNHGWKVKYFALQRQMFCDIALYKAT